VNNTLFTLSNEEIKQFGPGQPLQHNVVDFISALFQQVIQRNSFFVRFVPIIAADIYCISFFFKIILIFLIFTKFI
jgi:hypothetical protein